MAASPITYYDNEYAEDHIGLLKTIEALGIDVRVNDPTKCVEHEGVAGYWHGARRLFVLCQQAIRRSANPVFTGEVYRASDDDLDTIRHEAHHIVQDCMDGTIDGGLELYFTPAKSAEFLGGYPDWKEHKIASTYREDGASEYVIDYEIEAWAVADLVDARSISNVLNQVCL